MGRRDDLAEIRDTLAAVVEAANLNGDEQAARQGEILTALRSLDEHVGELAEAVRVVMAFRADHDAGVASAAEGARAEAKACREELRAVVASVTALLRQAPAGGSAGTAGVKPQVKDAAKEKGGRM